MITNKQSCLADLAWEPNPVKNQVGRDLVKDGANLPGSITEDIEGFSLCPEYSKKQLRRIARIQTGRVKYGHADGNLKPSKAVKETIRGSKEMLIRRAVEEGIF